MLLHLHLQHATYTRHDFTSSLSIGAPEAPGRREGEVLRSGSALHFLEVEDTELGRHPCLASLVAVIR